MNLTALVYDPAYRAGRLAHATDPFVASAWSITVANGRAFVTTQEDHNEPLNVYAFDLLTGQRTLYAHDVGCHGLLGVLGGVPVVVDSTPNAWLLTQPEHRVQIHHRPAMWQTTDMICCETMIIARRPMAQQLFLVDGRLAMRLVDGDVVDRQTAELQRAAMAARRLPPWCHMLCIPQEPVMHFKEPRSGPCLADDDLDGQAEFDLGRSFIDGQTGTVVWNVYDAVWALRGAWRPGVLWSPETHATLAPADRARALALLLCTRQHACRLPQRLVLRVIACVMDA